jgi:hypothetical protein
VVPKRVAQVVGVVLDEEQLPVHFLAFHGVQQHRGGGVFLLDDVAQRSALRRGVLDVPRVQVQTSTIEQVPAVTRFFVPLARRRVDQSESPVLEQDRFNQPSRLAGRQRPGRGELDLRPKDDVFHAPALLPAGLRGWVGNLPNDPPPPLPQVFLFVRRRRFRRRFLRLGGRLRLGPPGAH